MKPSRPFLLALAILVLAGFGLWLLLRHRASTLNREIAEEIHWVIGKPHKRHTATEIESRALWEEVAKFYRGRGTLPAWLDGASLRPEAVQLLGSLSAMDQEGLEPSRYQVDTLAATAKVIRANHFGDKPPLGLLALWDVRMTHAFFLAARDLRDGRVPSEGLDKSWQPSKHREDLTKILDEALKHHEARKGLAALAPPDSGYVRLREALARYRAMEKAGGWPNLPKGGGDLKRGASGAEVVRLRRRLAASGDLGGADASGEKFDKGLEAAVKAFQARHGLDLTGKLDAPTREAMNVPVEDRIRQIELNLERWRWLPDTLGQPRIDVNIPDFTLAVRDSGRIVMGMHVVVGRTESPTPIFSAVISYMEVNPVWRLPLRIVAHEILPLFSKDRQYFAKQNMVVTYREGADTTSLDPTRIDWAAVSDSLSPYLVTQRSGPDNPLGRVKLMCPNPYDVYLHDTPARGLFGAHYRALSHGCVRLEQPVELATRLLDGQVEPDTLAAYVASGEWKRIGIKNKMPVNFLYWTAWVDDAGALQFRRDVYGLDRRLDEALRGNDLLGFRVNLPPEQLLVAP
jgi:L,D-transpeptidase YcbB